MSRATGLPTIAPYALPMPSALPRPAVDWTLHPDRGVLLVHDMQNHFVDAFTPGADPIAGATRNIAALAAAARIAGVPVVYTAQPSDQDPARRGLLTDFWGSGLTSDPRAGAIVDDLTPQQDDTVLTKWRYDAFVRTELEDLLRIWGRDQLVVTGVYAHIGCLVTACDAFMRDIEPFLAADAVADFSRSDHDLALRWAASRCAAVRTTSDLLAGLRAGALVGAR
jgi:bifunctional isochorismate lyase/aryl carrier protein